MITTETLKIIADIGFMATSCGMSGSSNKIFHGISKARPDSVLPHIGQALNLMNTGNPQQALETLEKKAALLEPQNQIVQAFLGMALMMLGRNTECEQCLQKVKKSKDGMAQVLATELLKEIKK